jgi:RNA polymerase sigma-70 factor (ECF subfamily)
MATSIRPPSKDLDDAELAARALDGDGEAFAALYDRHERRVYGFCLRLLASEDAAADATQETFMRLLKRLPSLRGRELNFIAYALRTARNACYDQIASRRRVEPTAEAPEPHATDPADVERDPERAALLASLREQVRLANASLVPRQREVLALRELEELSYEQIAAVVGLNENAVAQLISRARIRLREILRGEQLASIAASSPQCERALPLIARAQDGQPGSGEDSDWLQAHLNSCETCKLNRAAMHEAGASYRALGPIVPLLWLRRATIARAAGLVGADWDDLHARARPGADHDGERHSHGGTGPTPGRGSGVKLALVAALVLLLAGLFAAAIHRDGLVVRGSGLGGAAVARTVAKPSARHALVDRHGLRRVPRSATALAVASSVPPVTVGSPTLRSPRRIVRRRRSAPPRRLPTATPVVQPGPAVPAPTTTPAATTPAPPPASTTGTTGTTASPPPAPPAGGGSTTGTGTTGGCAFATTCP